MRPVICMITDGSLAGGRNADAWLARVAAAARAGAHLIQVRERQLDDRALSATVVRCVDAARGTRARVIVNDRLDIALACRAHGVHLRSDSLAAARAKAIVPPGFLIGRSVHQAADIGAWDASVDYVIFGTVFATSSKPGLAPAGAAALADAVRATSIPVLAVGGINADNAAEVARTGAAGIAAISLFANDVQNVTTAVTRVIQAFDLPRSGS